MDSDQVEKITAPLHEENKIDLVYELFECFPTLDKQLIELFISFVLKEKISKEFEARSKELCMDYIRALISKIKQEFKTDKSLLNAYYDVARYQTDVKDAIIQWEADEDLLRFILKKRPPPETPEERLKLTLPKEVVKKREL